jgi:integral membrane protein
MNLVLFFRIIAFLEGLSYVLLLCIGTPIKYFANDPTYVKMLGMPHGILFVLYVFLSITLGFKVQLFKTNMVWILLASILPFGTFVVEHKLRQTTII